jgi:Holliday junction resolvasome RuvABC DNA-binding subunit
MITENAIEDLILITWREVLKEGAKKPRNGDWAEEPVEMHAAKCIRHLQTAALVKLGYEKSKENHVKNAMARAIMAFVADENYSEAVSEICKGG